MNFETFDNRIITKIQFLDRMWSCNYFILSLVQLVMYHTLQLPQSLDIVW